MILRKYLTHGSAGLHLQTLDEIDRFDYSFFGLAPKTAQFMDPNQRLFLQSAWHAIEDAGYAGGSMNGSRVGVF